MANNCLLTQLKEKVNVPSLAPLGYIRVPITIVSSTNNTLIDIVYDTADNALPMRIFDSTGQYLTELQPTGASISVSRTSLPDNSAFIDIAKYNLKNLVVYDRTAIAVLAFKGNELQYSSKMQMININNNLSDTDKLSCILYNKPSLTTLQLAGCKCVGDCADFALAPALTTINVRYSANITGTLESLAKAMLQNWTTNKTITLNSDSFTLNGIKTVDTATTVAVTQSSAVVTTVINGTTRTYTWNGTTGTYTGF